MILREPGRKRPEATWFTSVNAGFSAQAYGVPAPGVDSDVVLPEPPCSSTRCKEIPIDIVIHRCTDGWVFVPDIFDPGDAYFARSGSSLECRRVASQTFANAGLSELLDRIVSNSYLVLDDAAYRRIEAGLAAAARQRIPGRAHAPAPDRAYPASHGE